MRNVSIFVIAIICLLSCTTGRSSHSERRERKDIYVYSFKMTYFRKMLLAGFNNSPQINAIVQEDHSHYGEPVLSLEDYQFIDSIVAVDKAKVSADSAASIGRVAEGAGGKRLFDQLLSRYESKWLNSVAVKRSKDYIKSNQ